MICMQQLYDNDMFILKKTSKLYRNSNNKQVTNQVKME